MMKQVQRLRPLPPTNLTAGASDGISQTLSWTASARPGTGYKVYYRQTGTSVWLGPSETTNTTTDVSGLSASTSYQYRVTTYNSYGESPPCNMITATTGVSGLPPEPPVGLSDGGFDGFSRQIVNWTSDTSNDHGSPVTSLKVYVSTSGGIFIFLYDPEPDTFYQLIDTLPGVNYQVRITAVNANGESAPSNTISFTGGMGV